jgi:hypothetical protein
MSVDYKSNGTMTFQFHFCGRKFLERLHGNVIAKLCLTHHITFACNVKIYSCEFVFVT